ncbi:MAG TPA: GxxExxY protein [Gemmatimonadaceae bacterium]|nr:GxxExxY protein [Gemmatimonadaceae bacterium]
MGTATAGHTLLHGDLTNEIIGSFFEVYNELGYGFIESVYQRALPLALKDRGISSEREVALTVHYRGRPVGDYRADLVVEGRVIVESKVADRIIPVHELQLLNYLKGTGLTVGILLNFGPRATFRRMILTSPKEGSVVIRS